MPTRRQFLLSCSTAALTVSLTPASSLSATTHPCEVSLDEISFEAFSRQLRAVFVAHDKAGTARDLQLVKVQAHPPVKQAAVLAADARNEKFSLIFRGAPGCPLDQNTYWLEHPGLGRFALFMVPLRHEDQSHSYYEAIFNRAPRGTRQTCA